VREASRAWVGDPQRSKHDGIGGSMTWNTWWAAVSAVAGVVGIILLLHPFDLGRETKGLAVDTVSTAVLVDLSDPELSSLKLTYKDVSVSRLTVATIEVRNIGTRPIERDDFELPLVIRFKNPNDVLAVTLGQKTPQDLKPSISSDDRGITIAPLLLNPGDQFRITVQLRGDVNEPTVEARISGVPSISREMFHSSDPRKQGLFLLAGGIAIFIIYIYFIVLSAVTSKRPPPFIMLVPAPETIAVLLALCVGSGLVLGSGAKMLELPNSQLYPGIVLLALIGQGMMIPLARSRSSRTI
jgi:hypothetical protein